MKIPELSVEPSETPDPMRTAVRFPQRLPVTVETLSGRVDAVTEDISATGVQLLMPTELLVNSALSWKMKLPGAVMGTGQDVTLACVGRVVWCRAGEAGFAVGAVIDGYRMGDAASE